MIRLLHRHVHVDSITRQTITSFGLGLEKSNFAKEPIELELQDKLSHSMGSGGLCDQCL